MLTKQISADEAHDARREHLRQGPDGKERLLKLSTAPTSWNPAARSARFVMTSQTKDRYGDIVVTAGLDTTEFEKNPGAFLNHRASDWSIGSWANIEKLVRTRPPRMEGDLVLHEASGPVPEIDQAAWMIERGYLRASSIGFLPDWNAIEMIMGEDGTWSGGLQFNRAEILECSIVGIPANPQALAKDFAGDMQIAQEAIEYVLDTWARGVDGALIERSAFEDLYRIVAKAGEVSPAVEDHLAEMDEPAALALCERYMIAKGKVVISRERHEAIERAARNKRLDEKRQRELEVIRQRGSDRAIAR